MKTVALVLSGLMVCAPLVAWAQDGVIASAGGASVTQSDITNLLKSLDADTRARLAADPARLDQLVRARLAQAAVLTEAKAKGWDKQPQVKQLVEQAQRDAVARSYLASLSAPPADFPSDADMQAAYDQNRSIFTVPGSLHLAQIFVAASQGADKAALDQARKQAADLARQAHASGADFAAIAKASSQDKASGQNGGDMGFVPDTVLLAEVRKVADGMTLGEVSQPIETSAGFHVIKLIEKRPANVRPFAQVKEQIRTTLRQQRAQQNAQEYLAKAVGPNTVAINEDALKKALSEAQ
ncbi:peptidylprolyl isomerase [Caballeronia mineralivorans PML1(12)]|uniref:Peptidylprolyl isomerase n=1 Tax=Caballeronia mineralivorans PML1(12) TaxID=908627 RepID=A0A0J1FY30_9BURK|nr:peptidylprolyl isomerase [Caballeronia mineralivorans]KLU24853.1 peptidylprolyl isomerase [Caballeronia mineralivorans PML1(12)]